MARSSAPEARLVCGSEGCLLQPLGDKTGVGVDVYGLITVWPGRELVRGVGRHHDDLPGMPLHLLGSDGERCPTASDDERFGIRMLVQPWPDAGLCRRLQDDEMFALPGSSS
jgi:hypothetical protein